MGTTSTADSAQARALDRRYDETPDQPTGGLNFKPDPRREAAEAARLAGLPARLRTAMSQMEDVLNDQSNKNNV
ncbi:hypothetical protein [Pseudomonas sp.]|uniref:hypothetical protein n=1 Tax=Pseudomonas sp. TaxID=306 RepID=UPI003FD7B80D